MPKTLKIEFKSTTKIWHMYSLRFLSLDAHRDIRKALWKKNQGNQIKESGVAYAIN